MIPIKHDMDNIQIVQDVYKNFGERNVPGVLAHFDKDVVWMRPDAPEIPFCGTYNGHEGMIKFFTLVSQTIKMDSFVPSQFLSNGETVVVMGEDSAHVISTGKSYTTYWIQVFVLKDKKIVLGRAYIDTLQIAKAFQP
jgi:ketosteroid isomerase-like protein